MTRVIKTRVGNWQCDTCKPPHINVNEGKDCCDILGVGCSKPYVCLYVYIYSHQLCTCLCACYHCFLGVSSSKGHASRYDF